MSKQEYDVVVIGSGPGGYVCAIRCAQLGLKTAIVEKYSTLGGTCLNVGCIPSKAWLDSSERYHETVHTHADHGIKVSKVELDFKKMRDRVKAVVNDNVGGVSFLMKKNKIDVHQGMGSFKSANEVLVKGDKGETVLAAKNIIIATGSKPSTLPGIEIDKKTVITSTEALFLDKQPKSLVVIGGGVIGCEMASVYARLGTKVTIVEYADSLIGTMDKDLSKVLTKVFKKDGIELLTGHAVSSAKGSKSKAVVVAKNLKKGEEITIEAEMCLVAVGRRPFVEGLNLEAAGVQLDERSRVKTDDHLRTNISNIYAIGDVVKGAMLAHKAEEEGVFVAELIAGQKPHINYNLIPGVVYTWPEVSAVGATEDELKKQGIAYKVGSFPYKASGRARASNESEGLIKVLADASTDEILGVHMVGARCADMIAEAVLAMEFRASAEDVARTCHAHPTYTETFKEACMAASENRAIHI
ncbi:MAG: dihydrolipoyl dehydrogenase [Bdellovibrionales bacterium CG12_big_fil_rev_8_21_14_0_65_38_15]|nr:MAG: dihydrolipoyl dehydrogenase [Bdellovibrionales bacterium CG22_combo_CG10-13_8_21_14_all_38_13]PIQ54070.1 MAG: dihydrolipoyl dehydrogenase [Bdellovibrionales bacterium CG12_big_fil_rev_8_21_14_0_65_38_15]PIR28595.1 MAG: dihydrolipoyl dehydrogenase [Bdellovibrionales bacterium CG11_big_fil_rev_8_21_14_0_20_38_13]